MKQKQYTLFFIFILFNNFIYAQDGNEEHAKQIIDEVLKNKQIIINNSVNKSSESTIFLSFWDFDGTIIKGDCSEGMKENDKIIYKGIAQLAIENAYSTIYSETEYKRFYNDYTNLNKIGVWLGYPFIIQIFRGALASDIEMLTEDYFSTNLSRYYYKSSVQVIKELENNGIECHIISASPDIFVKGSVQSLGLPKDRFNGIEVKIENKKITEKIIYPVTWADGKIEKLKSIVEEMQRKNPEKQIIILAAFGNSYHTDGPFLKFVASQNFLVGKPTSVMINGGKTPKEYQDYFIKVEQFKIVGK